MRHKNVWLITAFSLIVCVLHAVMLQSPFNNYVYTSTFKVIAFLLCPLIYFKISKGRTVKEFFSLLSMNKDRKNIRFSFLLGFGVFAVIVAAFVIAQPFIDQAMVAEALDSYGITRNNAVFVFFYIVLINAAVEELFFRGFIFMSLYNMNLKRYAHIFSSLLFALYHVTILNAALAPGIFILSIAGLVAAGLIFNALALRCKSIGGSLIVHISANFALTLMIGAYYVFFIF
ncbi:MAG: CPBP family intramembrane metalloprotease [Oscillospiraceae bacterium]|nr:CPBP family intramembrane metalloprotease [Oscillospiraceae bacterium]